MVVPEFALIPRIAALYEIQTALLTPRLKQLDVSFSTFQLLAAIQSAGNGASQATIAERLGISPATLSETAQIHLKRGLIEQVPSPSDRRVKFLRLTSEGQKKLNSVRAMLTELEKEIVRSIAPVDLATAIQVLDSALETLENKTL